MADRHDVHPHHLLRALLGDRTMRDALSELGADPDEVGLTLDQLWLAGTDVLGPEAVAAVGIDLPTVLAAVNPPFDEAPDWGGRRLTEATRDVLVRALAVRGPLQGVRVGPGHLFLALMLSRDPLVGATLRAHHLHTRTARAVVERWSRRAT